ncbi:MAG: tRNA 2-thiouridine(34) synthase MnmA [Pseudomonadota bacterium]
MMSNVIVGLSGGVDSAVAALLLKQQGHEVAAVFMKNWDEDDEEDYCPAEQDLADARTVAGQLGIELHTVSFSAEYWNRVFASFLAEYEAGRTPSPDIICNREIKFRAFLDYATGLGADFIATGHYARIYSSSRRRPGSSSVQTLDPGLRRDDGIVRLLKGVDEDKDQTYFLHTLDQVQLASSLFPLGGLKKQVVREMAKKAGFPVYAKKDSTGICFIGERRFSAFLAQYLKKNPGEIRTLDDEVVGQHDGLMFYTIGQRQGLGIGGRRNSSGDPWYVTGKDMEHNILRVAQGVNHPALFSQGLQAGKCHWIAGVIPGKTFESSARIRHQQPVQDCTVTVSSEQQCSVRFQKPQRAITPGQSVVFYQGDECLGGAVIEAAIHD